MEEEIKIKGSPDYVSISGTETILNQMRNSICKIKMNQTNGTGFFCKIPYENKIMNVLMTNYHVLDEKYYNQNSLLNLFINDEKEVKIINLKNKRITYFNKKYDLTLIELKENDKIPINNYLELDDNLFKKEINVYYENISIYVLHYPLGNKAAVSYGLSNGINNYEINHTCSTEHGSSGSPILNLSNNKLIGIHKQGSKNFNYNLGTCLQFPLNDFFEKIKNENDPNKIINNVLNKYLLKSNEFYVKAKNYMNDMKYHIEQGKAMNITFNVFVNDINGKGYIMDQRLTSILVLKFGTTIDDMLKIYFLLKGRVDLINYNENKINFIWNTFKLRFGDKTPIEKIFNNNLNSNINVYLYNFSFDSINDNNYKYNKFSIKEEEDILIMKYFNQVFEEKNKSNGLINKNNNINIKIDNNILNKYLKKCKEFYDNLYNAINDMKYQIGPGPKININFIYSTGMKTNFVFNFDTTIDKMERIYLRSVFKEYIINNIENKIIFLYNGKIIKLGDKTPMEKYFKDTGYFSLVTVYEPSFPSDWKLWIIDNKLSKEEINLIKLYKIQIREETECHNLEPKQKLIRSMPNNYWLQNKFN